MAGKLNGWTKWVIAFGTSIALIILAWVWTARGIVSNVEANTKQIIKVEESVKAVTPELKQNSEHRIKFEEKVTTMEKNIEKILKIAEAKNEI